MHSDDFTTTDDASNSLKKQLHARPHKSYEDTEYVINRSISNPKKVILTKIDEHDYGDEKLIHCKSFPLIMDN